MITAVLSAAGAGERPCRELSGRASDKASTCNCRSDTHRSQGSLQLSLYPGDHMHQSRTGVGRGGREGAYGHGRAKPVELAWGRRVLALDRAELPAEIWSHPESASTLSRPRSSEGIRRRTFRRGLQVVSAVAVAADVLGEPNARCELALKDVALIQEQDKLNVRK